MTTRSDPSRVEVRLDLTEQQLEAYFLKPYHEGRPIVIGGATVPMADLERIRINYSDLGAAQIDALLRREARASGAGLFGPTHAGIAAHGEDVTDRYITSAPGSRATGSPRPDEGPPAGGEPDRRRVFVVHGRNTRARDEMFAFLRALSLGPIEWNEAVMETGRPSPYVGETLDLAFRRAAAVLVLITPDDYAWLKEEFHGPHEPPYETGPTGQARPNVLFEAGMAMGRDENRTVLVELGQVRPFSDIGGRHVLRMNDSTRRRQELAQRLQAAGCAVNMNGTDWHRVGDFASCV
ncbi:nucleotide-binding protein [Streptomyces sp. NPDC005573]|uniref:nucleotide-binding protein n=1 Tax=Streptomyces sp. NPDC005573 TaxID=3156890 RepID=UPI0033A9A09A